MTRPSLTAVLVMPVAEQRGGAELMLLQLLEFGRDLGARWIVVFLVDGPMVAACRRLGVKTEVINAGRLRNVARLMVTQCRLAALARREGATVMIGWMGKAHLYSGPAAFLARIPALWYQLGLPSRASLLDRLCHMIPARGILAVSNVAAAAQADLWPARRCRAVCPGVDLARFDPESMPPPSVVRERLGLSVTGPVIGIVGRLQRWKGMHVLIQAMPEVLRLHPDAHCLIVGGRHDLEPEYVQFLEEQIGALRLERHVTLTGLQSNIPEWMHAMDVVVHASDVEPFGIVVLEAMALGKPVIAGDRGGPSEIVTHGVDGWLSPYGAPDRLAEAINTILGSPDLASRLSTRGRERARGCSVQLYARRLVSSVQELLDPQGDETVRV